MSEPRPTTGVLAWSAAWRSEPDHLSLANVELKAVGSQPFTDVADAIGDAALKQGAATRLTEAINMYVISVEMRIQAM